MSIARNESSSEWRRKWCGKNNSIHQFICQMANGHPTGSLSRNWRTNLTIWHPRHHHNDQQQQLSHTSYSYSTHTAFVSFKCEKFQKFEPNVLCAARHIANCNTNLLHVHMRARNEENGVGALCHMGENRIWTEIQCAHLIHVESRGVHSTYVSMSTVRCGCTSLASVTDRYNM